MYKKERESKKRKKDKNGHQSEGTRKREKVKKRKKDKNGHQSEGTRKRENVNKERRIRMVTSQRVKERERKLIKKEG